MLSGGRWGHFGGLPDKRLGLRLEEWGPEARAATGRGLAGRSGGWLAGACGLETRSADGRRPRKSGMDVGRLGREADGGRWGRQADGGWEERLGEGRRITQTA